MNCLNREALLRAYSSVPSGLRERTGQTLAALDDAVSAPVSRRKKWPAALTVALSLLALSTALAFSLHFELTRRLGLPETVDAMVQTPEAAAASAVTNMATFTVDAYLFDGLSVMADVRVEPSRSGIWILPYIREEELDLPVTNLGINENQLSIREYAESLGIRQIRQVQITGTTPDDVLFNPIIQARPFLGSDGLIHYLLITSLLDEARQELDLSLHFDVSFSAQPREDTILLHLAADASQKTLRYPIALEALGVTIEQIEIIRTPAVTCCRMTYTYPYAPGTGRPASVRPVLLDADGQPLLMPLWESGYYDRESGKGVFQGVLPPAAQVNGEVSFRLYVGGQRSDPITVSLPSADR